MKRLALTCICVALPVHAATPLQQTIPCGPKAEIEWRLSSLGQDMRIVSLSPLREGMPDTEIWMNQETQTWSVIWRTVAGYCLLDSGQGYTFEAPKGEGEDS